MTVSVHYDDRETAAVLAGFAPSDPNAITRTGTLAFDNSYPAGGEPLTAAMLGLDAVDFVSVRPNGGLVFQYDYANSKLLALIGDWNNAADGPLIEEPDTTDLSARNSVHFLVRGRINLPSEHS